MPAGSHGPGVSSLTSATATQEKIMRCGIVLSLLALALSSAALADEPTPGSVHRANLGDGVWLETVYIPPGEFFMGSTPEEKLWATGIEGGAVPGTEREQYEGQQPRRMRVAEGFWMGRTEVTVAQFRRFVDAT